MSEFSDFIITRRKILGFNTRKSLAQQAGITPEYLKKIEDKNAIPSDEIVLRLADALDVDRKQLLFLAKKMSAPEEAKQFFELKEGKEGKKEITNYSEIVNPEKARQILLNDASINKTIKTIFSDETFWERLKPTGEEIQDILSIFKKYSSGIDLKGAKIVFEYIIKDHRKHISMAKLISNS